MKIPEGTRNILTQDYLKSVLHYDSKTGVFTRRVCKGSRAPAGAVVGNSGPHGFRTIQIDGKHYGAHSLAWLYVTGIWSNRIKHTNGLKHQIAINRKRYLTSRLAWFYMTGKWPENLIDHRNGDGTDNRFLNLRQATSSQNNHNRKVGKGYHWHTKSGKWVAMIRVNYKQIHLGGFKTEEEARAAYLAGCEKYHGKEWMQNKLGSDKI